MPYRVIHDERGVDWQVWEVHPSLGERRLMRERRMASRPTPDRRVARSSRPALAAHLTHGWLAFQSAIDRRRRAPIPPDWEAMTDDELLALLDSAESTGPPRRLIE